MVQDSSGIGFMPLTQHLLAPCGVFFRLARLGGAMLILVIFGNAPLILCASLVFCGMHFLPRNAERCRTGSLIADSSELLGCNGLLSGRPKIYWSVLTIQCGQAEFVSNPFVRCHECTADVALNSVQALRASGAAGIELY